MLCYATICHVNLLYAMFYHVMVYFFIRIRNVRTEITFLSINLLKFVSAFDILAMAFSRKQHKLVMNGFMLDILEDSQCQ